MSLTLSQTPRTMQRPGQGIVRDGGPATQHSEYPKHMVHPGFQPGTGDQEVKIADPQTGKPWRIAYVGGKSIRFPPVLAMDADQEAFHESQGYKSIGRSDPAAFAAAVRAAVPQAEVHEPEQYPKWIAGLNRSVNSAEQEAEAYIAAGLAPPHPLPVAASSEESTVEPPALTTEVKTLLERPDLAPTDDVRFSILEGKVDAIATTFSRLEGMLGRILDAQAPAAAPEPSVAAAPAENQPNLSEQVDNLVAVGPVPGTLNTLPPTSRRIITKNQRSAESIARGEKIRAGIAKRKAEAAQTGAAPQADEPAEAVVAEAAEPVE
jgi:hypothetical protein